MLRKLSFVIIIIIIIISAATNLTAQVDVRDSTIAAFVPYISYSYQFVGGDITKKYGNNSTIGGGIIYKTVKNFLWSIDVNYIFGGQVKNADSILWMVETNSGYIIDGNGTYALYALYERGFSSYLTVGKMIPSLSPNPNSGLYISAGLGYLLHRLRIDSQHLTAPQISKDYAKGYDQLTGGFSLKQSVTWFHMGNSKVTNFQVGVEFQQAFTKSLRDWDFSTMQKDNNKYFDWFIGLKVAWMLPIYQRVPDKYYYY